jgi:DNA-binding HxlR family transcriptional regulator
MGVSGAVPSTGDGQPTVDAERDGLDAPPVCSIAATLDVIGDRWSLLILRDIFRGARRFSEIQSDLGIAKNLLSDRLSNLVGHDVLERVPYQDRPVRYEYRLTAKGADLSTALIALMGWGDRWYATEGAPTVLVHERCGEPLEQAVRCPRCDETVSPGAIRSRPGPGRSNHAN